MIQLVAENTLSPVCGKDLMPVWFRYLPAKERSHQDEESIHHPDFLCGVIEKSKLQFQALPAREMKPLFAPLFTEEDIEVQTVAAMERNRCLYDLLISHPLQLPIPSLYVQLSSHPSTLVMHYSLKSLTPLALPSNLLFDVDWETLLDAHIETNQDNEASGQGARDYNLVNLLPSSDLTNARRGIDSSSALNEFATEEEEIWSILLEECSPIIRYFPMEISSRKSVEQKGFNFATWDAIQEDYREPNTPSSFIDKEWVAEGLKPCDGDRKSGAVDGFDVNMDPTTFRRSSASSYFAHICASVGIDKLKFRLLRRHLPQLRDEKVSVLESLSCSSESLRYIPQTVPTHYVDRPPQLSSLAFNACKIIQKPLICGLTNTRGGSIMIDFVSSSSENWIECKKPDNRLLFLQDMADFLSINHEVLKKNEAVAVSPSNDHERPQFTGGATFPQIIHVEEAAPRKNRVKSISLKEPADPSAGSFFAPRANDDIRNLIPQFSPAKMIARPVSAEKASDEIVFPEGVENMVDAYLSMHSVHKVATRSPHKRVESLPAAIVARPLVRPSSPQQGTRHPSLQILVSEILCESSSEYVAQLSPLTIQCLDCPLQKPLSFIIDVGTAICLLTEEELTNTAALQTFIYNLTTVAFKFTKLWVVILHDTAITSTSAYLNLLQCLASFPLSLIVRTSSRKRIGKLIFKIQEDALRSAALHDGVLVDNFYKRDFLSNLIVPHHAAQSEFLQLFSSFNFYLASSVLSKMSLVDLVKSTPSKVSGSQRASMRQIIDAFFQTIDSHIGLSLPRGGLSLPSSSNSSFFSDGENSLNEAREPKPLLAKRKYHPSIPSELTYTKSSRKDGQTVFYKNKSNILVLKMYSYCRNYCGPRRRQARQYLRR